MIRERIRKARTFEGQPCLRCDATLKYEVSKGCVACVKRYYANNRVKYLKYAIDYQKKYATTIKGKVSSMWNRAKTRATNTGSPFTITQDDLIARLTASEYCPITGDKFDFSASAANANAYAPSLDQIVPGVGYTPENIQIVCWWFNAAKGDWFTDAQARAKFGKVPERMIAE